MITKKFNVSHAPFNARGLALETTVCFGTFILFKILGCTIIEIFSLIDPVLSLHPDNGTKLRV